MGLSKVKVFNLKDPKTLLSLLLQMSILLLSVAYPLMYPKQANATITEGFVRFDRLSTNVAITGTACLKTATVGTESNPVIVFPQGWTISSTPGNWTVTTTNLPTDPVGGGAATAWPNITTASAVNGLSVTFGLTGSGDLTVGTFYCFNFSGGTQVQSHVGSVGDNQTGDLKTQGGSPYVDDLMFSTSVVAASGEVISVSASVSATMSFNLSTNSIALGTLTTGTTAQGTPTITENITTNARNGWTTWIKSQYAGLYSTNANSTIASPGTYGSTAQTLSSTGGYVVAASSGTATVYGNWVDGANVDKGGHLDTTFDQVATKTTPGTDSVGYIARARSSATTPPAGDYADTLTITAAGSF